MSPTKGIDGVSILGLNLIMYEQSVSTKEYALHVE